MLRRLMNVCFAVVRRRRRLLAQATVDFHVYCVGSVGGPFSISH